MTCSAQKGCALAIGHSLLCFVLARMHFMPYVIDAGGRLSWLSTSLHLVLYVLCLTVIAALAVAIVKSFDYSPHDLCRGSLQPFAVRRNYARE